MRRLVVTVYAILLVPVLVVGMIGLVLCEIWRLSRDRRAVLRNAPTPEAQAFYEEITGPGQATIHQIQHVPGRSDAEIVDELIRRAA